MATFGYAEMRDWAEQSDDPRVKSMWERLSNCRSKIAKWCQAAEYAELRTKNLAAENAALRAEVELAQSESRKARKRVAELSAEIDRRWQVAFDSVGHALDAYDMAMDRAAHDYDASCAGAVLADAVRAVCDEFLPAPPAKEE